MLRSGLNRLRRLWRDRRANALMMTAFALPCIVGAAGLGIHSIQLTLAKRQLQREADSAALAGALSMYQGKDNATATAAANQALTLNDFVQVASSNVSPTGSLTVNGTTFAKTMYVRLTASRETSFMALFGRSSATVVAEARAATVPIGSYCFLALEPGNTTGITFSGTSTVDLDCGVATMSMNPTQAIRRNGQPTVTASPLIAEGGIDTGFTSTLMPNHSDLTNPFATNSFDPVITNPPGNGSSPTVGGSPCKTKVGNQWNWNTITDATSTITPGCYGSIDINGPKTLPDGVYYIADSSNQGGIKLGSSGHLTCNHCTFVLTSTTSGQAATMSINGNAELDIGSSTSGTYQGMTIVRDSRAPASNQCCTINGNSNSSLSGAFYFPKDTLTFNGTAGMTLSCFQLVALRLEFSGTSDVTNTCTTKPGDPKGWTIDAVRLIS